MIPLAAYAAVRIVLLASVDGLSVKTTGHLDTCRYPSICRNNCEERFGQTHCADSSRDCPCIIQGCWALNGSCIHACNETMLTTCLECLNTVPANMCLQGCSGLCLDITCEHSQGECHGCVPGMYGQSCSQRCSSICNQSCYTDTGYCKLCQPRRHGQECEHTCSDLCHTCSSQNGSCVRCADGYTGEKCNKPCANGFYGSHCDKKCSRNCAGTCHHISGSCIGGCKPGYFRADCEKTCPPGTYGQDCASECPVTCASSMVCHHVNGWCTQGCSSGFRGELCGILCSLGTYGANCSRNCSQNCFFGVCNRFSGHCQRCVVGRAGQFCEYVTNVRHSPTNINDDTMSTDQTILIFLGLFAMGGAMWFLLGTFVYYKQKIIMRKVQQTGQLPKNWTSVLRRYPQYFYNPRFLTRSIDSLGTRNRAEKTQTVQCRTRRHTPVIPGGGTTRQLPQELLNNVHMGGQRNSIQMEGQRKKAQMERQRNTVQMERQRNTVQMERQRKKTHMEGHRNNVQMERQRQTYTAGSIEKTPISEKEVSEGQTSSVVKTRLTERNSADYCPDGKLALEKRRMATARTEMYYVKRGQDDDQLATMFQMEEDPVNVGVVEETGPEIMRSKGIKVELTQSKTDVQVRAEPRVTQESQQGGSGDTQSSTLLDMTISTTTGVGSQSLHVPHEENSCAYIPHGENSCAYIPHGENSCAYIPHGEKSCVYIPHGEKSCAYITQKEGIPCSTLYEGISAQHEIQNKKRSPSQERKPSMDHAATGAYSVACPVCGHQCVCSMECQCSLVSTAHVEQGPPPAGLGRAKNCSIHDSFGRDNKQFLVVHRLSHAGTPHPNMNLAAVQPRDSNTDIDVMKPTTGSNPPRDKRRSRSRHTIASILEASGVEPSTAGDTEGESSQTVTSRSGSSTLQTSKLKTGTSTATETEGDLSESLSTSIASSAMTETSGEDVASNGPSLSELQRRYFQAALERQSQPYLAKTDIWQHFHEENPATGVQQSHRPGHNVETSTYDEKTNQRRGFVQRSIRNMVGAFNKLMGGVRPQDMVNIGTGAADSSKTFSPNEPMSSQFLIHRLEAWRRSRGAATETGADISEMANKRQTRASSRAEKSSAAERTSLAETVTERSSAMSNTLWTSSRTYNEDSTLTDASEIEYSTATTSRGDSASTSFRSSQGSSTAVSTTSGTSVESTVKHTSTDVDSTAKHTSTDVDSTAKHTSTDVDSTVKHTSTDVDSTAKHTCTDVDSTAKHTSTDVESTAKHTSTDVESLSAATKITSRGQPQYPRPYRPKSSLESSTYHD